MKTLVVEKNGTLTIHDISMPKINEYQALVKLTAGGLCGSDKKIMHPDKHNLKGFPLERYPLMLGHESVGRVVEVGSKVITYKVGDLVINPILDPMDGLDSYLGGFSEYGVVSDYFAWDVAKVGPIPERAIVQNVLPEPIDELNSVFIHTLREVLSGTRDFQFKANESVVLFGCGGVGLAFVKLMSMIGMGPIFALDIVDEKLESAKKLGADYAFNSKDPSWKDKVREVCPKGVDIILEAVGMVDNVNSGMELLVNGGRICMYGVPPVASMNLDWSRANWNWRLIFQQMPLNRMDVYEAQQTIIRWVKKGIIDLSDFVSEYFTYDQVIEAYGKLERGEIMKKGVVRFDP